MADYIRREDAILAVRRYAKNAIDKGADELDVVDDVIDIVKELESVPAADVAEVVHGEWQGESDGYADGELVFDVWHCSNCDHCIDDGTDDPERLPNYCPDCGAKMDGGNNNVSD